MLRIESYDAVMDNFAELMDNMRGKADGCASSSIGDAYAEAYIRLEEACGRYRSAYAWLVQKADDCLRFLAMMDDADAAELLRDVYIKGERVADMAERMGVPRTTVYDRLNRAMDKYNAVAERFGG